MGLGKPVGNLDAQIERAPHGEWTRIDQVA